MTNQRNSAGAAHSSCLSGRRHFLKSAASAAVLPFLGAGLPLQSATRARRRVAAVVTVYTENSHTDVLIGKILEGWLQDGGPGPNLELVSMYVDQFGLHDMSRDMARRHGFRIAPSIDDAITLGTDRVQVDGVISIGEHGDYPFTPDTGQHMYPRRRFFDEITAAMKRGGRFVPIFNDKHLAYRWADAKFMYDTARELGIPFQAGSSVPVAWRFPPLQLDRQDELESALTIGWDGLEVYGFHALEAHQAMIERRRGGESGLVAVQALQGDAIYRAAEEGRWSTELLAQALATIPDAPPASPDWVKPNTAMYLLEHRDGLKSAVAMVGILTTQFAFAARIKNRPAPVATWLKLEDDKPYSHFAYLLRAIEETIHTAQPVCPIERTLLTTGTLDRLMHSIAEEGRRYETPELAIAYQPTGWPYANHPETKLQLPDPR